MRTKLILLLCILACTQIEVLGKGGGFRAGGFRSTPRMSPGKLSRGMGMRIGSKNSLKIGSGGSKGIRSFSKSPNPRPISKYVGKPFSRPKTISTSRNARRAVSYTYTKPVTFHNPYLAYYLLMNRPGYHTIASADTNAFPGFGKGKSGGGGASVAFADSLKKHCGKSTLEVTELLPINFLSDYAGIIPDKDEPRINYLIRQYKKITGVEMAVLTVPTLGDEIDLEEYAEVIFDKWGIGESGVDNGILIIISSEDEILRVQPGYGLEGLLPDINCRRIEDDIMIPLCKDKQWESSVVGAIGGIIKQLGNEPVETMKVRLAERQKKEHQEMVDNIYTCLEVLGAIVLIILIWVLVSAIRRR